jgi:response regulator RpfG family c-di-GMP phosphodiesterase
MPESSPTPPTSLTLLVVDEEEPRREALVALLEERFVVAAVAGAAEAEACLSQVGVDALLLSLSDRPEHDARILAACAERVPLAGRLLLVAERGEVEIPAVPGAAPHRILRRAGALAELVEAVEEASRLARGGYEQELTIGELEFETLALSEFNRDLEGRLVRQAGALECLRRLSSRLVEPLQLREIAQAAAEGVLEALGSRGVIVQVREPDGKYVEASLGPEMSTRMVSEPLRCGGESIGEIVIDVVDAWGRELTTAELEVLGAIAATTAVAAAGELGRRRRDAAEYATVVALARLSEHRDDSTGQHLERVGQYCRIVACGLLRAGKHTGLIDDGWVRDLVLSAPLHDIGKVGVPDAILLKQGKLTPGEWEIMKTHARIGAETLRGVIEAHGVTGYLAMGLDIALCHHERWDGGGYPQGLRGDEIPLSARILALADVYDALTTTRPYKTPWSHQEALAHLAANRGTHFDPDVVDAFLSCAEEADEVRVRLADAAAEPERSVA